MLHLVFKSPIDPALFKRMAPDDTAVFMDSAVLGLLNTGKLASVLAKHSVDKKFYALAEDLAVRGMDAVRLIEGVIIIDYAGLVDLTVQNTPVYSWY